MSNLVTAVKGFADLFQEESRIFRYIEDTAISLFSCYGYTELRTPLLERTELFFHSIGLETDVVQKEMYTFIDRKERSLTLRPEATAGIMRAYIESKQYMHGSIAKFLSIGPMFRYERPQRGRMRQFHQVNCECLGSINPYVDAELIVMLIHFLRVLEIPDFVLQLNSLGCNDCRPAYKNVLQNWLDTLDVSQLCEDCRRRKDTNPLRVLDCKVPSCRQMTKDAPSIVDHQCPCCTKHFTTVTRLLDFEHITYKYNPRLVRGLDYYTRTTFEVISVDIGSQGAIAGGGRYDGLSTQLGGPDIPGIGFACGIERLALLLPQKEIPRPVFMVAALIDEAQDLAFMLTNELRNAGLHGEQLFFISSMKSMMRHANRSRIRYCLLLGSEELASDVVSIKDMDSGIQQQLPLVDVLGYIVSVLDIKHTESVGTAVRKLDV